MVKNIKCKSREIKHFEYRLPEELPDELKPTSAVLRQGIQLGVIAQELQEVLPECITECEGQPMSVNSDKLIWLLINSVKELINFSVMTDEQIIDEYKEIQYYISLIDFSKFYRWNEFYIAQHQPTNDQYKDIQNPIVCQYSIYKLKWTIPKNQWEGRY